MTTNKPDINITNESENKMKYIGTNKREFVLQILLKKNLVIKPIKSNAIYIEIFNLFTFHRYGLTHFTALKFFCMPKCQTLLPNFFLSSLETDHT